MVKKDRGFQTFAHIVMAFLSVLVIFPILLLIISSFTSESELMKHGFTLYIR